MTDSTNVTIYSTPTCGYCKAAKDYFKNNDIEYTEHDVSKDTEARQEMIKKTGQLGVPVIEVGDEVIVGFDKDKLSSLIEA